MFVIAKFESFLAVSSATMRTVSSPFYQLHLTFDPLQHKFHTVPHSQCSDISFFNPKWECCIYVHCPVWMCFCVELTWACLVKSLCCEQLFQSEGISVHSSVRCRSGAALLSCCGHYNECLWLPTGRVNAGSVSSPGSATQASSQL